MSLSVVIDLGWVCLIVDSHLKSRHVSVGVQIEITVIVAIVSIQFTNESIFGIYDSIFGLAEDRERS